MGQCRDVQGFAEIAETVGLAGGWRLGQAEEEVRDLVGKPRPPHGFDRGDGLHQGLGRVAGFGDDDETGGGEVEAGKGAGKRAGIEIVVEAGARARPRPIAVVAGNIPAAELGQRLAPKARAAGAKEEKRRRTLA